MDAEVGTDASRVATNVITHISAEPRRIRKRAARSRLSEAPIAVLPFAPDGGSSTVQSYRSVTGEGNRVHVDRVGQPKVESTKTPARS